MRGSILALTVWAGCGFSPGAATPSADGGGPGGHDGGSVAGADASGSGSGSGSACAHDIDNDGICDDVDDWLCGTKPSAPGDISVVNFAYQFQDSAVKLDGQSQKLLAVAPNQSFMVEFGYQLTIGCNNNDDCKVQIELGTDVAKEQCADSTTVHGQFVGVVQVGFGSGTAQTSLALATPGQYRLLATPYKADQCPTGWGAGSAPGNDQTVAIVCVR